MANNKNKKKMDVKSKANSRKDYFKYVVLVAVLITSLYTPCAS